MKIGAFGEVMLRLTPPEHLMLEQTHTLRMAYTGTGVNLVGNLAHFGVESYLLTALPDNRLGKAALTNLNGLGYPNEVCDPSISTHRDLFCRNGVWCPSDRSHLSKPKT